jgi:hypothetical protein
MVFRPRARSRGAPAAIYAGEENTAQGGISLLALNTSAQTLAFGESLVEPLTKDQVLAIVGPFII